MPAVIVAVSLSWGCASLNRMDPADPHLEVGHGPRKAELAAPEAGSRLGGERIVRVVTYNVHGATGHDLVRAFRSSEVLGRADIVLLQEVEHRPGEQPNATAQLASALGMSYASAPGYGMGDGGTHGVAIVSRFPLRDLRIIELPRQWVVVNSARRVALAATVPIAGVAIRVYAVHLDNRVNPGRRIAQIAPLFDDAAEHPDMPAIAGGDFNTSPFCWLLHLVPIPCGKQTTRLEAYARGRGFDAPVVASGPTSEWLGMRLDGIYTRAVTVIDFDVARYVRISDHLPLWLDFKLEGNRAEPDA